MKPTNKRGWLRFLKLFILAPLFIVLAGCTNPEPDINLIEQDLEINIPENFETIKKDEDWLGFDATQIFTFKFQEEDYNALILAVEKVETWKAEDPGYTYSRCIRDESDKLQYCVEAKIDSTEQTLDYKFMGL